MKDYSDTIFDLAEYEVWCNLRILDFFAGRLDPSLVVNAREIGFAGQRGSAA